MPNLRDPWRKLEVGRELHTVEPVDFFLRCLPLIDRIIAHIVRRHGLSQADADEFAAWAKARLLDNDCAILGKFEGRSTIATFLTVVLNNLFRDWRNGAWGRWRPSAAARRMGPLGIRLEELLVRDGYTLREAIEILRAGGCTVSDAKLARMAAQLPTTRKLGDVTLDDAPQIADSAPPPDPLASQLWEWTKAMLAKALERLSPEERQILRLHYWEALTRAEIARILKIEQKPLYRRIPAILRRLHELLLEQGLTEEMIRDLLSEEGLW